MKFSKFFSNIQETPWYRQFLNPVIDQVSQGAIVLDIGTGTGKLLQILADEKSADCVGVDTNEDMLLEARLKLQHTSIELLKIETGQPLPFEDHSFDIVTICNVLFHLEKDVIDDILIDVQRLLTENGKIIILTPTGSGNYFSLTSNFLSFRNRSIYIWYRATKNRAKLWNTKKYLQDYASKNNIHYSSTEVMKGFAQLEILKFNS